MRDACDYQFRYVWLVLPFTDVIYFGDIKNVPYGQKSPEELSKLTEQSINFLHAHGAKNIISACNSVSASLATSLSGALDFSGENIIEMVEPTMQSFSACNERILLCATPATINSGMYQDGFRSAGKTITTVAISELAGAIEFGASEDEIEHIINTAFADVPRTSFDTLVLGCTHYPLVTHIFTKVLGSLIHIVDPAQAVTKRVEERFSPNEVQTGTTRFYITKESSQFRRRVATLFSQSENIIEVLE